MIATMFLMMSMSISMIMSVSMSMIMSMSVSMSATIITPLFLSSLLLLFGTVNNHSCFFSLLLTGDVDHMIDWKHAGKLPQNLWS